MNENIENIKIHNELIENSDIPLTVVEAKKIYSKIYIRHNRVLLYDYERRNPHFIKYVAKHLCAYSFSLSDIKSWGGQRNIFARGGLTEVTVIDKNNVEWHSSSICNINDTYVKNIGIANCLRDIYNQINKIVK